MESYLIEKYIRKWRGNILKNKLCLRYANKSNRDADFVWKLREESIEYHINKKKWTQPGFNRFFKERYFSNKTPPYIIMINDTEVGFIGSKTVEDKEYVGISLSRGYRGYGLGARVLKLYLSDISDRVKYTGDIVAEIEPSNIYSIRIFRKNRFKLSGYKDGILSYKLSNHS